MTREEAISCIKQIRSRGYLVGANPFYQQDTEAIEMAISALSQVTEVRKLILQAERSGIHLDYGAYLFMNALEKVVGEKQIGELEQEPCDDTVSIRKDVLKCRVGKLVVYNVEWLKKHWQMEMDIVCGVKPCDDAISREVTLDAIRRISLGQTDAVKVSMMLEEYVKKLPSVTQKPNYCASCKHYADNEICLECEYDGLTRGMTRYESVTQKSGKCKNCKYFEYNSVAKVDGIPLIVAHEICNKWGNGCKTSEDGYCYLYEPQESEDKE